MARMMWLALYTLVFMQVAFVSGVPLNHTRSVQPFLGRFSTLQKVNGAFFDGLLNAEYCIITAIAYNTHAGIIDQWWDTWFPGIPSPNNPVYDLPFTWLLPLSPTYVKRDPRSEGEHSNYLDSFSTLQTGLVILDTFDLSNEVWMYETADVVPKKDLRTGRISYMMHMRALGFDSGILSKNQKMCSGIVYKETLSGSILGKATYIPQRGPMLVDNMNLAFNEDGRCDTILYTSMVKSTFVDQIQLPASNTMTSSGRSPTVVTNGAYLWNCMSKNYQYNSVTYANLVDRNALSDADIVKTPIYSPESCKTAARKDLCLSSYLSSLPRI